MAAGYVAEILCAGTNADSNTFFENGVMTATLINNPAATQEVAHPARGGHAAFPGSRRIRTSRGRVRGACRRRDRAPSRPAAGRVEFALFEVHAGLAGVRRELLPPGEPGGAAAQ
jgi:hypothetical protein